MKHNGSPELNDCVIELYQDKRGSWRWRFLVYRQKNRVNFWDIMATCGGDSYGTMEVAEHYARWIICTAWTVRVDTEVRKPGWFTRLLRVLRRLIG